MRSRTVSVVLILLFTACDPSGEVTTFILVRHAEKASDGTEDPDLTEEGRARAQKLSAMFNDTPLAAIYSTNYQRTRNTVQPIADEQNIDVSLYETFKPDAIAEMVDKHRGGTVLVSGHSNTIPWTANLLMGEEAYEDYAETEYGIVLIISVAGIGRPVSVVRVNY